MRIKISPEVARWNELIEKADNALAMSADDVTDPRKLLTLLFIAGISGLHSNLLVAGAALNYWAPDGGLAAPGTVPGRAPGQPPRVAPSDSTKSTLEHAAQILRAFAFEDPGECLTAGSPRAEACELADEIDGMNDARPGGVANVILEREEMRKALKAALDEMRAFRAYWTSPNMNLKRSKCLAEELAEKALGVS